MTSKNSIKRALFLSALSVFMCVSMLIGTTFAWFTDTASTGVNKIQAGNLDVALEMQDADGKWVSAEGKTLQFKTDDNRTTDILWEPGCRYELPALRVVNDGSLALKYKIQITGIQGDAKLNDVIDWTINGKPIDLTEGHLAANEEGTPFTIKGVMKTTAGNEYQGLSIDGIGITVYATQDTVENDSFGNDYDKDATYDAAKFYFVNSLETLKTAAAAVQPGDIIELTQDITVSETVTFDASKFTLNGNGHTITANMNETDVENLKTVLRFGHDTVYCTGVTVKDLNFVGNGGRAMHFHGGTSSLLENVKISGGWSLPINFFGTHGAVMNNCDISSDYADKYAKSSVFANEQSANQIILNNTKIDSIFVNATEKGATYANGGIKLVVNSGSTVGVLNTNVGITRTLYTATGSGVVNEVVAID